MVKPQKSLGLQDCAWRGACFSLLFSLSYVALSDNAYTHISNNAANTDTAYTYYSYNAADNANSYIYYIMLTMLLLTRILIMLITGSLINSYNTHNANYADNTDHVVTNTNYYLNLILHLCNKNTLKSLPLHFFNVQINKYFLYCTSFSP